MTWSAATRGPPPCDSTPSPSSARWTPRAPAAWLDFKLARVDERARRRGEVSDGDDYRARRVDAADASAPGQQMAQWEHCAVDLGVAVSNGEFAEMESPGGAKEWVAACPWNYRRGRRLLAVVGDVQPALAAAEEEGAVAQLGAVAEETFEVSRALRR